MELLGIADIQYALPVAAVLILALLVFAFGFKRAPELPFDKLSYESNLEDKKSGKRRSKPKDKKAANGQVTSQANQAASESKSEAKKTQSSKSSEKKPVAAPANKAKETSKADNKRNVLPEVKTKKSAKKVNNNNEADRNQVPEGFDDAGWVQAVNKKDKKLRKREDGDLKSDISSPDGTPLHKKNKAKNAAPGKLIEAVSAPVVQAAAAASTPIVEESKPAKVIPAAPVVSEPAKVVPAAPVVSEPAKVIPAAPIVPEPASKPVAKPEPRQVTKEDKKKKDKSTPAPAAPVIAAAESVEPTPAQTATPIVAQPAKEPEPVVHPSSEENSNVAFDELADVWQETKGQKKKKKARRD